MQEEKFSEIGRIEAIEKLFDGTGYRPWDCGGAEAASKGDLAVTASRLLLEGIDFDLVYFPLKHLGYKSIISVIGELYASMARPTSISVVLGLSAKLDFGQTKEIWEGMAAAAKEHRVKRLSLDLVPSRNGLCISVSGTGFTSNLTARRRMPAKSMDLICISGNLGGAFMGMQVLEREKKKFSATKDDRNQPKLDDYRHLIGAYLKPEINPGTVEQLEDTGIIPSYGYLVTRGLGDAVKRLSRDSGFGVKIYVDKIPFPGKMFDVAKEFNIDPMSVAMNGGEDCRLLFTIPIGQHEKFRRDFQVYDIIGHLAKPEVGQTAVTPDGVEFPIKAQGWKQTEQE